MPRTSAYLHDWASQFRVGEPGELPIAAGYKNQTPALPSKWSEMIRIWISDVPSKIFVNRASRQ